MAALSMIALGALTAGSAISSFATQRQQAGALERQGDYERQLYGMNADLAELQAEDAIARGHEAELRQRSRTRQVVGAQRAGLAAQGIALDDGSAADVQAEADVLGELDALTLRNNARREAWGYRVQATDLRNRGALTESAARNQAAALRTQSYSTLLTGGADLVGMGYSGGWFDRQPARGKIPTKGG